jgi:hypothetical protein
MKMVFLNSWFRPEYVDLGACVELDGWPPVCGSQETSTSALHAQNNCSLSELATLVTDADPAS